MREMPSETGRETLVAVATPAATECVRAVEAARGAETGVGIMDAIEIGLAAVALTCGGMIGESEVGAATEKPPGDIGVGAVSEKGMKMTGDPHGGTRLFSEL